MFPGSKGWSCFFGPKSSTSFLWPWLPYTAMLTLPPLAGDESGAVLTHSWYSPSADNKSSCQYNTSNAQPTISQILLQKINKSTLCCKVVYKLTRKKSKKAKWEDPHQLVKQIQCSSSHFFIAMWIPTFSSGAISRSICRSMLWEDLTAFFHVVIITNLQEVWHLLTWLLGFFSWYQLHFCLVVIFASIKPSRWNQDTSHTYSNGLIMLKTLI